MNLIEKAKEFNKRFNQIRGYNSEEIIKKTVNEEMTVEQVYIYSELIPDWVMGDYNVDDIRKYNGLLYRCRQTHTSTGDVNHTPDITPALWSVVQIERTDGGILDWIAGELVRAGTLRKSSGVVYECTQEHTTQSDWNPTKTPALWEVYVEPVPGPEEEEQTYPVWKQPTGGHDAYQYGDIVWFNDKLYQSIIQTANAYSPAVYPAGWKLIS